MYEFKFKEIRKTNTIVEYVVTLEGRSAALRYAHNKALRYPAYIKTIFVYNEHGYIMGGWSRAIGKLKYIFG